jgi:purine-binding chemotaxis protein CheW
MLSSARNRPDPNRSLLGFVVGGIEYAVPISSVRQIVNPVSLSDLPHSPPAVVGVAEFRREVVPIIDMRVRLGLPPAPPLQRSKWILLGLRAHTVGLSVDRVTEVFGTGGADLKPVPELGGGEDLRGIEGAVSRDGHLVFVLEVSAFDSLTSELMAPRGASAQELPR